MKIRTTLVALAAVATLSLTACGNDDTGGSAQPAGGDSVGSIIDSGAAGASDSAGTDDAETGAMGSDDDEETDGDSPAASEETDDSASTDDDAETGAMGSDDDEETDGDSPAASEETGGASSGSIDMEGCAAVGKLMQDFNSEVLQKITSGEVTQADIDGVFTDERMAEVPEAFKEDVTKLKEIATAMVGKSPQELATQAADLQETAMSLLDTVKEECTG